MHVTERITRSNIVQELFAGIFKLAYVCLHIHVNYVCHWKKINTHAVILRRFGLSLTIVRHDNTFNKAEIISAQKSFSKGNFSKDASALDM